jgi:hypothetical protein
MKLERLATHLGYSALGLLTLMGTSLQQTFADDRPRPAISQHHHPDGDSRQPAIGLIKAVREATARFRDVSAAQAEGYELMFGCVSGPDEGAMGLHYTNLSLVTDGELDVAQPEIVLYEPLSNGRLRITGADYLVFAADWDATHTGPPELMGQLFHLFESPNRFGLPAFYTLHVWAWKDSPVGSFVNWHPNVSCDKFESSGD